MPQNSIGNFDFIAIDGLWIPPFEQVSIDQRGGVDGSEITAHGTKGRPFTVQTSVDQASYPIAVGTIQNYLNLINDDPVAMIYAGRSSETVGPNGFKVAVLDVQIVQCLPLRQSMGGLNPPSLAWLVCRWTLLAIENEPPEPAP